MNCSSDDTYQTNRSHPSRIRLVDICPSRLSRAVNLERFIMKMIYQNEDFVLYDDTDYGNHVVRILTPTFTFRVKDNLGNEVSKMYLENRTLMYTQQKNFVDSGVYEKETFRMLFEKAKKFILQKEDDIRTWAFFAD